MAFQGFALLALGAFGFAISLYYICTYNGAQQQEYGPQNSGNYSEPDIEGYEGINYRYNLLDSQLKGRKRQSKSVNRRRVKTECTICLLRVDDEGTILPCQHQFHTKCIKNWRLQGPKETRHTCPNCRNSYVSKN